MATVKWSATTSRTTGIASATVNAGANSLGSEIDNTANKDRWASAELTFTCGVAPTANKVTELYFVSAVDGTNYEDGDGSVDPVRIRAGVFPARAVTTAQKVTLHNLALPPFKFKCLLKSELDQNATSVTLLLRTYNEEIA